MSLFPESVLREIEKATAKHPTSTAAAANEAEENIRQLPEFEHVVSLLVKQMIRELVYNCRHEENTRLKKELGFYGRPSRIVSGTSHGVARVNRSVYNYYVAGTILGNLTGSQLIPLAEKEENMGHGHYLNAKLIRRIHNEGVEDDKLVRQAISERRLRSIFREVGVDPGNVA